MKALSRRLAWLAVPVLFAAAWLLLPRPELYPRNGFSTAVYDRAGRLLQLSLAPDERYRVRLEPERIAPVLVEAVRLYEDRHFFTHPGVNPAALARAGWSTYISGNRVVGGSTLTMQLARLRFRLETRSIGGKLLQIFRALQLERHYGKREILAAYLNLAPYGGNIEGVGAASLIYFGKPAAELSLPEALALAVIPQNPSARNPLAAGGGEALFEARTRLFEIWLAEHPDAKASARLLELPLRFGTPAQLERAAPHFARDVALRHPRGGEIMTTLDAPLQGRVETLVGHYLAQRAPDGIRNAAVLVVDTRSNGVLVEVGSADFSEDAIAGQVNGARAKRSPGSALKPFIYGLALDQGLIHPMTLLKDAPRRYGLYTPENFDREFQGPVTAHDALIYSRNVPAVELLSKLHAPDFYDLLVRASVSDLKPREHYGLALALGGNEVSMHELAGLYSALANGGLWRPLRETDAPTPDAAPPARLLSAEAAFLVLDMLTQTPRPHALPLPTARTRLRVAWKTGTSFAFRDAWSVGVVGPYVLAVWIGNFDGSGNPAFVGIRGAAPLFFKIADQLAEQPGFKALPELPPAGLNLVEVPVCEPTGDLPGRYCPRTALSWFIPGVSPIKVSDVHRAVRVDTVSGLRACWNDANVVTEIYAIWPSDLAAVFRQAGISFPAPPPWHERCPLGHRNVVTAPPTILSPDGKVNYALRPDRAGIETIPFQAVSDGEARKLFWFVDDRFVGNARPRETFFWNAEPGKFTVRVVDDLGQAATSQMTVGLAQ